MYRDSRHRYHDTRYVVTLKLGAISGTNDVSQFVALSTT